jgi:hypothetical protein
VLGERQPPHPFSKPDGCTHGRHAPGEECGDAPKRGLLGLDLREMRISNGAIS